MAALSASFVDRAVGWLSPSRQLQRTRARIAHDLLVRHYEAASNSYRTQQWRRSAGDANAVNELALGRIRDLARDGIRNNPLLRQAVRTIANHTVGWGIVAKPYPSNEMVMARWRAWAESRDCDADGRHDLYGLQKLVVRGVAEAGEMLVRRRWRRLEDGYAIPMQLQVLEPDYLDTSKTLRLPNGGRIVQGVEFDPLGERVAYWLFSEHPGSSMTTSGTLLSMSRRIPVDDVEHIFDGERAGQVRAVSWFASIILPAKELDEYGDAQLMKQKIAACLAVITSDPDGSGVGLGKTDDTTNPGVDLLSPGAIVDVPPGKTVTVVDPPRIGEYEAFTRTEERKLAKGAGLSYEDFSGDYSNVNFSSARMARLEHYDNVYDWRWRMLIPQFCDPAWRWAMEAMQGQGLLSDPVGVRWTAPPMPMIEPDKEGLAVQRNIRIGITTTPEALRERGVDPDEYLREQTEWNRKVDAAGIVLDSDPRKMTQAGQFQSVKGTAPASGGQ